MNQTTNDPRNSIEQRHQHERDEVGKVTTGHDHDVAPSHIFPLQVRNYINACSTSQSPSEEKYIT